MSKEVASVTTGTLRAMEVSITCIDELLEAKDYQGILALPMDYSDMIKCTTYLRAVSMLSVVLADRLAILSTCYTLAVSQGALSRALEYALACDEAEAVDPTAMADAAPEGSTPITGADRVRELFRLCVDPKARPAVESNVLVESQNQFKPVVCVSYYGTSSYKDDMSEKKHVEFDEKEQIEIRNGMILQLAHQLSRSSFEIAIDCLLKDDHPLRSTVETTLRREDVSQQLNDLAKDLDVAEPKPIDDVFKVDQRARSGRYGLDPAPAALAAAYASAFVHAGLKEDATLKPNAFGLVQRARLHGVTGAVAAAGLLSLWDVESGLLELDRFQYSGNAMTRAGAALAFGVNNSGSRNDCDPVLSLTSDALTSEDANERIAAYISLGYAYCCTASEEMLDILVPVIVDSQPLGGIEASCQAALALGFVYCGSGNLVAAEAIVQSIVDRCTPPSVVDTVQFFNSALALGLIFLQTGEDAATLPLELLSSVEHPVASLAVVLIESCAAAGTGDVVKVQWLVSKAVSLVAALDAADEPANPQAAAGATAVPESVAAAGAAAEPVPVPQPEARPNEAAEIAALTDLISSNPDLVASGGSGMDTSALEALDNAMSDTTAAAAAPADPAASATAAAAPTDEGSTDAATSNAKAAADESPAAESNSNAGEACVSQVVSEELEGIAPGACLLGIALITIREPVGSEMFGRLISHMLQFDGLFMKRAIPAALMITSASDPQPAIVELLTKLAHAADADVALHAIVALGVVAAGTNNARVAGALRTLASYYSLEPNAVFLIRVAQGMVHAGKGLLSMSPLHNDRVLINKRALAGLLAFAVQSLLTKDTLCHGRYHLNYLHLALALRPRHVALIDTSGNPVPGALRVGQRVDTAGLAGHPKSVTGFRVHDSPVVLGFEEKAELGTADYQPFADTFEGVVIVRPTEAAHRKLAAKYLD